MSVFKSVFLIVGTSVLATSVSLEVLASQKAEWSRFLSGQRIQFSEVTYTFCSSGELVKSSLRGVSRGLWTLQTTYADGIEQTQLQLNISYPTASSRTVQLSFQAASGSVYFSNTPALSFERNEEECLSPLPPSA